MYNLKVSICVPIYGVEKYIEKCLQSLFGQTYPYIEYVFVNDCTPDRSMEILNDVLNDFPNRKMLVKIVNHGTNRGLSAARNTAIQNCTGDFIMWVDPDDYISINTVELAVIKQQEDHSDIVSFNTCVYYENYNEVWKNPLFLNPVDMAKKIIAREAPIILWARLIRLSLYKEYNLQSLENINMSEDYQISPLLAYYSTKVSVLNKVLYHYNRTNEDAYTFKISIDKIEQTWKSFNRVKDFFSTKGDEFKEALEKAEIVFVNDAIISCVKNPLNDDYYKTILIQRVRATNHSLWRILPWVKRIIFYIDQPVIIRGYVMISNRLKHLFVKRV